jgi:two-component system, OmpR family, KDP operon response regulator KdpE
MARVLVVDDEPALLRVLARDLRMLGWETVTATDPDVAMELVRGPGIDAVVTDLNLSLADGTIAAQAFRRAAPDVPVLVVTGEADPASIAHKLGSAQVSGVVSKPWRRDDLAAALAKAIHPLPVAI